MASYKILSCDGGGIRGLLATILLERLEEKLGSPLSNHFDMFAGTSTGSIIACCLAKGMSASTVKDFYLNEGKEIFPDLDWRFWVQHAASQMKKGDSSLPLFESKGLETVLQNAQIFPPDLLFGSLLKPTIVVSYDAYNRTAIVFKSNDARFAQIPTWEVCRSSSAAPVAFPSYFLSDKNFIKSLEKSANKDFSQTCCNNSMEIPVYNEAKGIPLIDGGVVANNPVLCAIAEHLRLNKKTESKKHSLDNIIVASFGSGQSVRRMDPKEVETWGGLDWFSFKEGIPILDVFADGSADATDYITIQLIGDNYHRFQPLLIDGVSTFQADKENFKKITLSAHNFLNEKGDASLDNLVQGLKTSN